MLRKFLIAALALALSGCGALAPVQPTAAPPPTAVPPVVVTVVVVATNPPTTAPSDTPAPTQTPAVVVVTATGGSNTAANTSVPSSSGAATATATLPSDAGGSLFTNLTRSGSFFDLRCLPQDITFNVSTSNLYVVEVDLFYRMEDLTTVPPSVSDWKNVGKMISDKNGNFSMDLNTSLLSPDLRAVGKAWFDYQFVGISKTGDAVGRSGKISQQILYLKDCP